MSEEATMLVHMKAAWISVRGVWSNHPALDWIAVALLLGAHGAAVRWTSFGFDLPSLAKEDRMRLFTTVASVAALMFGFATASIAFFYGSARGERIELLKQYFGARLIASWRGALSAPLVAVGVTIVALVADVTEDGRLVVGWVVEAAVILLAVRGLRLRWLFVSTLSLMNSDANTGPQEKKLTKPPAVVARPGRRA